MEEKKYLKWYNKIGYGSGDIAGNVVYAFLTSFMMVYLTDSVGLAAGVVGTLIAVSKLFDGFTDIFFGSMIDKTHSKMGKAKPWMLYGYIGCAITLVGCFAIPVSLGTTAKYAWFFISYTLLNGVFYTANNIAYSALTSLITKNSKERVESDYTFVADSEKMKVEVSYTFDTSELGGQNLVTFEELYDLKNPEEPVKVAEHKDIDDEGQTVLITERKISIHTTATDKNGKKEIEAGKDLTIVDTVTLEGMEIGTNYKLSGWQMVKAENAKLIIDGKEVTNDYEFTADKENMEVQIEFTFDGSTLGRKQLVTFEELYDITNPEEPKKVTEHKEINDEGQTVTIKEVPETPTPETPGTTTKTSNPPKTGDTANAILWIAILVLSAAGITGVRIWNKKKQVKRLGIEEKKEEEE